MAVVLSAGTVNSGSGTVTPILMRRLNGDGTADADALAAGDKVEHYYYAGWRVIEETDAASTPHVLAQTVCADGVDGQDAHPTQPVCRDRNTDSIYNSGSPDSDCLDSGGSQRYFYHQDANFRVVMLTDESGAAVERYDYDAYGEPRIWAGVGGAGVSPAEMGSLLRVSRVGNPLMHQGLRRDDETGLHENRYRTLHSRLGRFMQRDPLGYWDALSLYELLASRPVLLLDPLGLEIDVEGDDEFKKGVEDCLAKLSQNPELKKIFDHLRNSKHKHTIKKGPNSNYPPPVDDGAKDPTRQKGVGCGTTTTYNPKKTANTIGPEGERKRDPCVGLMHELAHAYLRDKGIMEDYDGKSSTGVEKDEEYAIGVENIAREIFGDRPRTCYNKTPVSNPPPPSKSPATQPKAPEPKPPIPQPPKSRPSRKP